MQDSHPRVLPSRRDEEGKNETNDDFLRNRTMKFISDLKRTTSPFATSTLPFSVCFKSQIGLMSPGCLSDWAVVSEVGLG